MHIGMLWFDNTPGVSLQARIEKAADYYRQKYHQVPNLCLVHPKMLSGTDAKVHQVGTMEVRAYGTVLPGHLWIGQENTSKAKAK